MTRKIILYIAMSLDGFIAAKDGAVSFLDEYGGKEEDYGYAKFYAGIDSIIMGHTTYRQYGHTPEFDSYYKGKPIYVFSKNNTLTSEKENIHFVHDDIESFFSKQDGTIWMLGGGKIFNAFLEKELIDEMIITIIPMLLGEGVPLFGEGIATGKWSLAETKSFPDGVVQVHYVRTP